jgi:transposase
MLADQLDYIVGVDPHRDAHALAVLHVLSGAVVFETSVSANSEGYAHALELVDQHAAGRRAFAVEGTGSFGAGLTRFLAGHGEQVLEVGRLRRERRSGGKTDALDAIRAARSVLAQSRPATPRASGEREALRALMAAREGAVNAKRAGLCQLRDLLVTTPEPLRGELRPLTRARLLQRLAATRPGGGRDPELRGALLALRSVARRVLQLTAEERELAREIETITRKLAPQLLDQPGVGPLAARPLLVPPRPDHLRSGVCTARRLRPDPRELRANSPLPPRPKRRPQTQPRTTHDPRHQTPHTSADDRLHRTAHPRRQEPPRSDPLPQALPSPQPLPPPRTRTATSDLTDIEASLAQPRAVARGEG